MASFGFDIPDDFMKGLLESDYDEICESMISEAQPIVVEEMQKQVKSVIMHPDSSTGELVKSIKASKPSKNKSGNWNGFVGPKGYSSKYYLGGKKKARKYKLSNAAKLVFIEYGTSRQTARPILATITKNTNDAVIARMQEVYNRKVGAE